jgi:hypothetical protein
VAKTVSFSIGIMSTVSISMRNSASATLPLSIEDIIRNTKPVILTEL